MFNFVGTTTYIILLIQVTSWCYTTIYDASTHNNSELSIKENTWGVTKFSLPKFCAHVLSSDFTNIGIIYLFTYCLFSWLCLNCAKYICRDSLRVLLWNVTLFLFEMLLKVNKRSQCWWNHLIEHVHKIMGENTW